MTYQHDHNHDHGRDTGRGNTPAPAAASGALTSLAALTTALNQVDTSSVLGRSSKQMLAFRSRENGAWQFGQRRTEMEDGVRCAFDPTSFMWGFICFNDANKVVGERLVSVAQPKPDIADLPDKGFPWQEQWAVSLRVLDGADAGTELVYKPTTTGGIQAVASLIEAVRERLNGGQHGGDIVPIALLERDSYAHREHGRIWIPILTIVDWMPLSGPAPAPAPASPPPPASPSPAAAEQPRRRRVA